MSVLPTKLYSVAAVREIDRIAIEDAGIAGYALMERAGAAAVAAARAEFPDARRWQVVCGAGNNGGDGYVVARLAAAEGIDVGVLALVDPAKLKGDAAMAFEDFKATGGSVVPWSGKLDAKAKLLVDAILGSGLERDLEGDFAAAVTAINAHGAPVHAMDIPSGINGDSGDVMGAAVIADLTTTFVGLKVGMFFGDGPGHCGKITYSGLDIGDELRDKVEARYRRIDNELLCQTLPARAHDAHKGDFGHVLVVGGGPGMPGAARLCAEAALRAGAGRVSLATHPDHAGIIAATRPEIMAHAVSDADELEALLANVSVVAFGPGLGKSGWAEGLYATVAANELPCVWDADGLNLLAMAPDVRDDRIITPHPGEAATLLDTDTATVQQDRRGAVDSLAGNYGGVAVLKGARTLVSDPVEAPRVCLAGNPGMATAGMGDVLTGVIAALLAQGLSLADAAAVGVEVHARAGDVAARDGERGMLASDVILSLRGVVNP